MKLVLGFFMMMCVSLAACAKGGSPLPTADHVDIQRYLGKWYAITSLPQFFTRNCLGQTAEYGLINPQMISVKNTCLKRKGQSVIYGQAVVDNAVTNAELIVTFNSFFTRLFRVKGDYNIIKLDPDYQYALVGSRNRKSLWILARTQKIPSDVYKEYVNFAKDLDFPVEKLRDSEF